MKNSITKTLKSLEKTRSKFWNISSETGEFLNLLIKDRKIKKIFEIGASNGYSGIWIAEALKETNGHLYTMESNKNRYQLALKNFEKSGLKKYITLIQGHAPEDIPKNFKKFDLIFFDATKYEHLSYLQSMLPHTKINTLIITDNINSHKKELSSYIKNIKSLKNWLTIKLNIGTGLLISYKLTKNSFT